MQLVPDVRRRCEEHYTEVKDMIDQETNDRSLIRLVLRSRRKKGSPYTITERRVPELISVLAVSLQVTHTHLFNGLFPGVPG